MGTTPRGILRELAASPLPLISIHFHIANHLADKHSFFKCGNSVGGTIAPVISTFIKQKERVTASSGEEVMPLCAKTHSVCPLRFCIACKDATSGTGNPD